MSPVSWLAAWRLPLRMARRDALRHRGRSVLVLVMIALPVLAVTTADVVISTAQVSGVESIDRRMGSAAALVTVQQGISSVEQAPDPDAGYGAGGGDASAPMPTAKQVVEILGRARLVELRTGDVEMTTGKGHGRAMVTEVALTDPVTEGLFDLTSGHLPRAEGEVVVNQALLDKGYAVGDELDLVERGGSATLADPVIVGAAESTTYRDLAIAAGPLGTFGVDAASTRSWLVAGEPVSWHTVRELNAIGATVASRSVITDPPPDSEVPASVYTQGIHEATVAVLVLIVVMALIEVVLLAGPAFAVGARKQQRSLALMAAAGGTPVQSRRVVVAGALVLGGAAAVGAVILGIGLGGLLLPLAQSFSGEWLGPFDVSGWHLLGIAGFGLLSAFLAAVVPARIASRQDVLAVLAGRRGDRAPSLRSPALGLVLLAGGVVGSVLGARGRGEILIAASAIPAVLGMILLIPLVLVGLGRLSSRLPVVLRYAVRDAARQRTRTVPAVAAVAATVAGVVALGIAVTSDDEQNLQTYEAALAEGTGVVTSFGYADWAALRAVLEREVPGAKPTMLRGLAEGTRREGTSYFVELLQDGDRPLLQSWSSSLGSSMLVRDESLPPGMVGVGADDRRAAEQALSTNRVVAFTDQPVEESEVELTARVNEYDADGGEETARRIKVPALLVHLDSSMPAGVNAVLPPYVADQLGVPVTTVALVVDATEISGDQEENAGEALAAISQDISWYVERGYQADDETVIVQLILLGLGAVLMLGGTLTATFLALSDARPDLATLSAVGASPRTRRGVAASYAVVVGLTGALLGAAVGFIPGIAVAHPLTTQGYGGCVVDSAGGCVGVEDSIGPFIDVPWLMFLGLVVLLPLLTALVVAAVSRSRLPMVARLD